jgi:hypothetical protein
MHEFFIVDPWFFTPAPSLITRSCPGLIFLRDLYTFGWKELSERQHRFTDHAVEAHKPHCRRFGARTMPLLNAYSHTARKSLPNR